MSAFPGAGGRGKRRVAGKRSDASDQARNIGRTGINFQCCVKTINGIDSRWQQAAAETHGGGQQKSRHEAGLFELIGSDLDQYFATTGPPNV
jgi:hypothetical protein